MKKAKNSGFKFKYAAQTYTPSKAKLMNEQSLRAEYTRMRDAVQKRLQRLGGTEWGELDETRELQAPIKKLSEIGNKKELYEEFNRAYRFLRSQRNTVRGYKSEKAWFMEKFQDEKSALNAYGITNEADYVTFKNLMNRLDEASAGVRFDSPRIKKFFEEHAHDKGKNEKQYREKLIQEFFDKYVYGIREK